MKLGLITPTSRESDILESEIPKRANVFHQISGMGKVNAAISASYLINKWDADTIVLIGFAGGLRGLDCGDVVEGSEFIEGDFDATEIGVQYPNIIKPESSLGKFKLCPIITQDTFLTEDVYKHDLSDYKTLATDMESYSVARVCQQHLVPFYSIRVVSDSADQEARTKFDNAHEDYADILRSATRKVFECLKK